jgi:hypothetical protein
LVLTLVSGSPSTNLGAPLSLDMAVESLRQAVPAIAAALLKATRRQSLGCEYCPPLETKRPLTKPLLRAVVSCRQCRSPSHPRTRTRRETLPRGVQTSPKGSNRYHFERRLGYAV